MLAETGVPLLLGRCRRLRSGDSSITTGGPSAKTLMNSWNLCSSWRGSDFLVVARPGGDPSRGVIPAAVLASFIESGAVKVSALSF
ncbi:MAG TPA: hypothetical protein VKP68_05470 [Ramlibacter sp.]|nr:hypothetical protein [Ramlibacter sp.]